MRLSRIALAGLIAFPAASCGDGTGPAEPVLLEIVAGDAQAGYPGELLGESLAVRIVDGRGSPVTGAQVGWGVVDGDAVLNPPSSLSDADGIARTSVRLGTTLGVTRINAALAGLDPVTFAVEAFDPCAAVRTLFLNTTASGALASSDCALADGTALDFLTLNLAVPTGVRLDLSSGTFDTYLLLLDDRFFVLGADDDGSGLNTNSSLRALLPVGSYVLGVTSSEPAGRGDYSLSAADAGFELAACEVPWATLGLIDVQQQLEPVLCPTPNGQTAVADYLAVVLSRRQVVVAEMNSPAFAGRVRVFDRFGQDIFTEAATGPGQTASLTFTVPSSGVYFVQFTSDAGAGGAYAFSLR